MTPQPAPAPETAPRTGEASRIVNVFLEPKAAFADIAGRPSWIVPMVLMVLVSIVFVYAYTSHVGVERMMNQQMENNTRYQERMQQLPAEQRQRAEEMAAKIAGYSLWGGAVVGVPLFCLIVAALLLFVFKVLMSAELSFKNSFAIAAWAAVPRTVVGSAATIAIMFLKNPDDFDLKNAGPLNIGAYLDPQTTNKAVMSLAGSLDLFTIWMLVLLAVGVSATNPRKLPFGKAFGPILGIWLVLVLARAGIAAAF